MKERAISELVNLKGVKKRKIDAYFIKEADKSYIKKVLENGCACTAAGVKGAINIWKTDAGVIRGEAMRRWTILESTRFSSYAEAAKWAEEWLDKIK